MAEEKKERKTKVKRKKFDLKCRICGNDKGLIRKYNLSICRRCFKDIAEDIGFKKYGYH